MREILKKISISFTAGAIGALISSLFVWGLGYAGINQILNIRLEPVLTADWLYPRIVWGGLWGISLICSFLSDSYFKRGIFYSLIPTLWQFFILLPGSGAGLFGIKLGEFTPVYVFLGNAVWGISAVTWLKFNDR